MSRIVTARPSGTVTGNSGNGWKTDGGATTFATAHLSKLGDDVKTSYAITFDTQSDLDFELGSYTKTADERIRRVRLRVKSGHSVGPGRFWLRFGSGEVVPASLLTTPSGYISNWSTEFTGPWIYAGPTGAELTQSDVDSLRMKMRSVAAAASFIVSEVYLDIDVVRKPVASVPAPVQSNGKASITPTVNWTLGDPTDTQSYFQIKVFTKAVAEGVGFDPDDLTHLYMTGVTSSYTSHAIPSGKLSYGNEYYVFVKPWVSMAGVPGAFDYEGDWSEGTLFKVQDLITTTVTAPADPVTNIDSPTAAWSVTDPNGDTYGAWKLRLFTAAQYGIAGFNPATSPATYEASSTTTIFPNHQLPRLVNGTTYRVYVQTTSKTFLVPGFWEYKQFTMSLTQPPAPSLVATPNPSNASVLLTLLSQANLLTTAQSSGSPSGVVWLAHDNATATQDTFFGEHKQKLTPLSTGSAAIKSPPIAIHEGFDYFAVGEVRKIGGTNRNGALGFRWLDASLAPVGGAQGAFVLVGTTNLYPTVTAMAPAGAAFVEIIFTVDSATTSDTFTIDQVLLKAGSTPAAWSAGAAPLTHLVERSDDQGATWQVVRGYPTALAASALSDYEAPFNRVVQYRASSITTISGSPVASEYGSTSTTLSVGVVWIKNPLSPEQNAHVYVEGAWLPSGRYKARQVHKPLGSTLPKVVRGEGDYETFSVNFLCIGDAMHDALEEMLASDSVLCVQSGKKTRYVEVSGDWTSSEYLWDDLRAEGQDVWKVTIPFTEVAAP